MLRPGKFVWDVCTRSIADRWERVIQFEDHPFYYITSYGRIIRPAHDFLTDLGSTPRILWALFPPHFLKPCVVCHDWDYDTQMVPRRQADVDLLEMIYTYTAAGAFVRRTAYWLGVRIGGWHAWRKDVNSKLYRWSYLDPSQSASSSPRASFRSQ